MSILEASAVLYQKETGFSNLVRKQHWNMLLNVLGFILGNMWETVVTLGVGAAYDRVGTKDSIMIRVPDHTITAHLCGITGPLAITSANPSGEPDSTHHDMVIK